MAGRPAILVPGLQSHLVSLRRPGLVGRPGRRRAGAGSKEEVVEAAALSAGRQDPGHLAHHHGEERDDEQRLARLSCPGGAPGVRPAPFAVKGGYVPDYLRFSPDGTQILATFESADGVAVWLLPFPDGPRPAAQPHQMLLEEPSLGQLPPSFSWMPDSRHVVMAFRDTAASLRQAVDGGHPCRDPRAAHGGVTDESQPDVSPDGSKIVFTSGGVDHDLVEVPLDGSPMRDLLATSRNEHSAAWVPGATRFVYMTDRSGREEIRLRSALGELGSSHRHAAGLPERPDPPPPGPRRVSRRRAGRV